jgi:hypothetical protein
MSKLPACHAASKVARPASFTITMAVACRKGAQLEPRTCWSLKGAADRRGSRSRNFGIGDANKDHSTEPPPLHFCRAAEQARGEARPDVREPTSLPIRQSIRGAYEGKLTKYQDRTSNTRATWRSRVASSSANMRCVDPRMNS